MRPDIAHRLSNSMSTKGYDAVVCLSPQNYAYVAGFVVPSHALMRWRHAGVVVTANGDGGYLTVDMEESTVRSHVADLPITTWKEFTGCAMQSLAGLLTSLNLDSACIGIEMDYLSAGDFERLGSLLPRATFRPAEKYLARARQTKTPDEIELMSRLSRISDQAIIDALSGVKPGSTEMDIAAGLTRSVYQQGATEFKLMIVATGERSVYPNVGPTMRQLTEQDICRVEIFSVINGYHAGVCRTARVATSPPHADEIWKTLTECKYLVLDMIKPGASSRDIYDAFIQRLSKLNLPPIKFVGHSIGVQLHEPPYLGMHDDVPLEAGMVLGIEPLVYNTGHGFGMQNKDIVLVTETGSRLLSDVSDTDDLFTVR